MVKNVSSNEQIKAKMQEIKELASKLAEACEQLVQILTTGRAPPVAPAAPKPEVSITAELQKRLDPALYNMLTISEEGEVIIVKPKGYLGTDNFIKLATVVREFGGEYVSAGRESHFRIKRKP